MRKRPVAGGSPHTREDALSETGCAFSPLKTYDPKALPVPRRRVRVWDTYFIFSPRCALTLTVSNQGNVEADSITLWDFDEKRVLSASRAARLPKGKRILPQTPDEGMVRAAGKEYEITFRAEPHSRQLYGHMYDFRGADQSLLFDLELRVPGADRVVSMTSFEGKADCFYFGQKLNCLPVNGRVIFNRAEYLFSPASSFACLDRARCVLPRKCAWLTASASGAVGGKTLGLSLAQGLGRDSANENALFWGGKAHQLGAVLFEPRIQAQGGDLLASMRVWDDEGRLDVRYEQLLQHRFKGGNALMRTTEIQSMGYFSGFAALDSGDRVQFDRLTGCVRNISAKG